MNTKLAIGLLATLVASQLSSTSNAQTLYSEDFTGATTKNKWYFFNGACLTAGSVTSSTSPGYVPSCASIQSSYYNNETLVGGQNGTLPDSGTNGALRFTNGYPGGYHQNGAIVSQDPFDAGQGVQITFKTVTYRGDSGGNSVHDGADGISFYLMDASQPAGIGAWGGSLGYSCSNTNAPYDGLVGAYLGLGIDEYGNFLNPGDNTVSGPGYLGNRIGLRGAGNVSWSYLTKLMDPTKTIYYYPSSLTSSQRQAAVQKTCSTGTLWNYSSNASNPTAVVTTGQPVTGTFSGTIKNNNQITAGSQGIPSTLVIGATITDSSSGNYIPQGATVTAISAPTVTISLPANGPKKGASDNFSFSSTQSQPVTIPDYPAIPNASQVVSGLKIANESAMKRGDATPIFYNLKITQDGLLSFSYSLNGGAYQTVIKNQDITASNGTLPDTLRFGFAGSTGGSTNIHELMCFKATPSTQSGSSAAANEKQAAKIDQGSQAFFAYYNPNNWTGKLTANNLLNSTDANGNGTITIATLANWDASCVLTGVASNDTCEKTGVAGPTAAEPPNSSPNSRVMLTWNGTGVPFQWGNISSTQQQSLSDSTLVDYLRGDRSNEINTKGVGLYRARDSVLADIVDSSPAWVGAPSSPYTATWKDRLYSSDSMLENSSTYSQFISTYKTRLNVVYAGANDGFLHGFRAGSFDSSGNFVNNSSTPNDGWEVLAYMPAEVLKTIHNTNDSTLDYSNTQYGHNFFVDATPGTGDLYYGNAWHSWLVGGLGPGGKAIYALDITDPSQFSESNAASLVIGEWSASSISCTNVSNCGNNLGNTHGTPQIRRLHNGKWAVIWGNGYGSTSGDAGIFVMTVDQSNASKTFYYLSTGNSGSNGIAYTTPADLDGDHITDYIYAGDLKGNVWRFDLTSNDPTQWKASTPPGLTTPAPLFTASGQPITSQLLAITTIANFNTPQLLIEFGTGQRTQLTNTAPVTYASGTQSLYGMWDWNLSAWNSISTAAQYASLGSATDATVTATATGLASPFTLAPSNLQQQTFTIQTDGTRTGTANAICWQHYGACDNTTAATTNNKFGWYVNLPGSNEQIVYNPVYYQGAFIVNSVVPAVDNAVTDPTSCTPPSDTGFTYSISVASGSAFKSAFSNNRDYTVGLHTDGTGSSFITKVIADPKTPTDGKTNTYLIMQTINQQPLPVQITLPSNVKAKRLTWVELR